MPLRRSFVFLGLILLALNSALAQKRQYDYDSAWKNVDQLFSKKGLPQSALKEVDKIYAQAKKDGNEAQTIRAVLYTFNLSSGREEDHFEKTIDRLRREIASAGQPSTSILYSILATTFQNYLEENRYHLYERTQITGSRSGDLQTWSLQDLHAEIDSLFSASLSAEPILKKSRLEDFDPILLKGNTRRLRPTLYDLLAHRALEYYSAAEKDARNAADDFELNDPKLFAPARDFIQAKFTIKDSSVARFKAIAIYQRLLSFHINDPDPDAFLDLDLARLNFMKQWSALPQKEESYRTALENILEKYGNDSTSAQASYLLAEYYFEMGNNSGRKDLPSWPKALQKAIEICDKTIALFPETEGGTNCYNLRVSLLRKELQLQTEKVNIPGQSFRTLVQFKNINRIYLRLIKSDFSGKTEMNDRYGRDFWKKILALNPARSWQQELPSTDDYRLHGTEIKIEALPVGEYILICSAREDFTQDKNPLAVQYFYVSNISYVNRDNNYFALHRETGKPLSNAVVQVWKQVYDPKLSRYKNEKGETLSTDKNGYFKLGKGPAFNNNIKLEISWQKDHLNPEEYIYNYYVQPDIKEDSSKDFEDNNGRIYLFTDRSIYRPGQTVYFKALGITKDAKTRKPKLWQLKHSVELSLTDPNDEQVDSISLNLNEYGSLHGQFRIPANALTGSYKIETGEGDEIEINVEEYKRPKFYVDFEKPKGLYSLGQQITLTGFARAYAGNVVDGAKVKYRVTRRGRLIIPWYYFERIFPQNPSVEIAHGETITGADGKFGIKFESLPDLSIDSALHPFFDYIVQADITDLNGETRTGNYVISIGYKALWIQIRRPDNIPLPVDSLKRLSVFSSNSGGEFEEAKLDLKIFTLVPPQRLLRARLWNAPDLYVMTENEFVKNFPHDEYKNETSFLNWPKGKQVYSDSITTTKDGSCLLRNSNFGQGWYVIELTGRDKFGSKVDALSYFQLYDPNSRELPGLQYNWAAGGKDMVLPGEKITFIKGSSSDNIFLVQELEGTSLAKTKKGFSFFELNKEKRNFEFPITEDDRGGFGICQFFVKDNRLYQNTWKVNVPWTNKALTIDFETFREKLEPGSEEKWKLKIKGVQAEKISAEMLVNMYDASLDQFSFHSWSMPELWPYYNESISWMGGFNFASTYSQQYYFPEKLKSRFRQYDQLAYMRPPRRGGIMFKNEMAAPGLVMNENARSDSSARDENKSLEGRITGFAVNAEKDLEAVVVTAAGTKKTEPFDNSSINIRKKFNETAFFFPDLRTDEEGSITFNFTMPEALTQWKLMAFAHTPDLSTGYAEKTVLTQRRLMVQPNAPRFLRDGDSIGFSAKIANLSAEELKGQVQLELFDATTNQPIDALFSNRSSTQTFTVRAGQSIPVLFALKIPANFHSAIAYRILAKAGNYSDGEENALPVLSNQSLVTEATTLFMKSGGTKTFKFEKLLQSGKPSSTLSPHSLTVEYTANPAWYAVQSLPYLMEFPYECSEQTFNRLFANALATSIANSNPGIRRVWETWKNMDSSALLSNLQKNEELKDVMLRETPWVMEAKTEAQQKMNLGLLFDLARMSRESGTTLAKLKEAQLSNGGFAWFKGGIDNRYITQLILMGLGKLESLKALGGTGKEEYKDDLNEMEESALAYCDKRLAEEYNGLIKRKADFKKNNLSNLAIQYLYMSSFFPKRRPSKGSEAAISYYQTQARQFWLQQNPYMQGMIALSLYRIGDTRTSQAILASLKENSIATEELGRYWKANQRGYYWQEAPIETQALLIEAFSEISRDEKVVNELKTWLLRQKQTNHWSSTRSTADACYALLLKGTQWIKIEPIAVIRLGDQLLFDQTSSTTEGLGYHKKTYEGNDIRPEMGNISVTVSSPRSGETPGPSWGAVYWQYFEDMDKISAAVSPLSLVRKLFIEKNTDKGPVLKPVSEEEELKVGDKIKVRMELRVDRDLEYVHLKDQRAASMEPVNVISGYKWQGGLGYYESTRDAATDFFFDLLPKGTYVFEYPLFITHIGRFSAGIASIQCMYAPEFTSHSEGIRIKVK